MNDSVLAGEGIVKTDRFHRVRFELEDDTHLRPVVYLKNHDPLMWVMDQAENEDKEFVSFSCETITEQDYLLGKLAAAADAARRSDWVDLTADEFYVLTRIELPRVFVCRRVALVDGIIVFVKHRGKGYSLIAVNQRNYSTDLLNDPEFYEKYLRALDRSDIELLLDTTS